MLAFGTVEAVQQELGSAGYIASDGLAVSLFLALAKQRALFLEGEAGVGKTEIAKMLAQVLDRDLIRLQCYEGLDINQAAYEWNYARQLVEIQAQRQSDENEKPAADNLFREDFLIERPLLRALRANPRGAPILLIDEIDRADEAFEAYLLELLSDWQISIPELGTIAAATPPIVIITSNNEKELPDAFLRRCFFHYIRFPDMETMKQIVEVHHPGVKPQLLTEALTQFYELREQSGLKKKPSTSEVLDWLKLLLAEDLTAEDLKRDGASALPTLHGALLKNEQDVHLFERLAFMARRQRQ